MKYDFNRKLLDLDGKPMTRPEFDETPLIICQKCGAEISVPKKIADEDLTLGIISRSVLVNMTEKELQSVSGDKKNDRFILATQIKKVEKANTDGEGKKTPAFMNLEGKELTLLQKLIGEKMGVVIVGEATNIFDNEGEKPEPEGDEIN